MPPNWLRTATNPRKTRAKAADAAKRVDRSWLARPCEVSSIVMSCGCARVLRRSPVDNYLGLLDPTRQLSIGVAHLRDRRPADAQRLCAVFWTADRPR